MIEKNKMAWYGVGGVVVLAVIVWALAHPTTGTPMYPSASESPSASASPTAKVAPKGTVAAMPKTYSDAVTQYAGKRIQFDQYCQAIPTSLNFKNGVSLMLDNRSGDARTIKIDGLGSYALSGYGWKIVTLTVASSKLPARLDIDCGSAQNVSYIILEK